MDNEKVDLDVQTLLAVARALQSLLFEEESKINPDDKSVKTLRRISRTYGISDCINIVSTMIYSLDFKGVSIMQFAKNLYSLCSSSECASCEYFDNLKEFCYLGGKYPELRDYDCTGVACKDCKYCDICSHDK